MVSVGLSVTDVNKNAPPLSRAARAKQPDGRSDGFAAYWVLLLITRTISMALARVPSRASSVSPAG